MRTHSWDTLGDRPKVGWMFGPTSGRSECTNCGLILGHVTQEHMFCCKSNFVSGPWALCSF